MGMQRASTESGRSPKRDGYNDCDTGHKELMPGVRHRAWVEGRVRRAPDTSDLGRSELECLRCGLAVLMIMIGGLTQGIRRRTCVKKKDERSSHLQSVRHIEYTTSCHLH